MTTSRLLECLYFVYASDIQPMVRLRRRLHYEALHLLFEAQTEQNPTHSQSTHSPSICKTIHCKRVCSCKHFYRKTSIVSVKQKPSLKVLQGNRALGNAGYSGYTWKNIYCFIKAWPSRGFPLMTSFNTLWELCVVRLWLHMTCFEKPLDIGFCETTNYPAVCSAICLPFCHT